MFSKPESREAGGILILAVALAIFLLACGSPPGDPTWPPSQFPDEEKETIQVGAEPIGIAVDYSLNRIYVTNHGDGTVSVIDPDLNEVISTIDVGGAPYDVLWDGSDRLFITDDENDRVVVLRTTDESTLAEIPVGLTPRRMALLPTGDLLYVGHRFEHEVWVLDASDYTVVDSVECQFGPVGVAVSPDGDYVFATTYVTEDVRVIRTSDNTVVQAAV